MALEQLDIHKQQNDHWTIPYGIHKNEHKVDHRPICKTSNYKSYRRKDENLCDTGLDKHFLDIILRPQFIKEKNHILDFI